MTFIDRCIMRYCEGTEFDVWPVEPFLNLPYSKPVRTHVCKSCGEEYTEFGVKPMLYTAQYRYPGRDRLDITVKGNCPAGKLYAPTWDMVRGIKDGSLQEIDYTGQYYNLLIRRWNTNGAEMHRLVDMVHDRDVTVVCFCPAGQFCHRHLLVKFLQHNWAVEYGGERTGF